MMISQLTTSLSKNNIKIFLSLKSSLELFATKLFTFIQTFTDTIHTKVYTNLSNRIITINTNMIKVIKKNDVKYNKLSVQLELKAEKFNQITKQDMLLSEVISQMNVLKQGNEQFKLDYVKGVSQINEKLHKQESVMNNKIELIGLNMSNNHENIENFKLETREIKGSSVKTLPPVNINENGNANSGNGSGNKNTGNEAVANSGTVNSYKRRNTEYICKKDDNMIFEDANNKLIKVSNLNTDFF